MRLTLPSWDRRTAASRNEDATKHLTLARMIVVLGVWSQAMKAPGSGGLFSSCSQELRNLLRSPGFAGSTTVLRL